MDKVTLQMSLLKLIEGLRMVPGHVIPDDAQIHIYASRRTQRLFHIRMPHAMEFDVRFAAEAQDESVAPVVLDEIVEEDDDPDLAATIDEETSDAIRTLVSPGARLANPEE